MKEFTNHKMKLMIQKVSTSLLVIIILFISWISQEVFSQCTPGTVSFYMDLSSNKDTTWFSPPTYRKGLCCGNTNPDRCIRFEFLLHPSTSSIKFDIFSGAIPSGSMFYQINCGPPVPVGGVICINGPGPHILTFCKPGNNKNVYSITSIAEPEVSNSISLNEGCSGVLSSTGMDTATISWTSISPGSISAYDSAISCLISCDSINVTALPGLPPYVDFKVCGNPIGNCDSIPWCDTVRVYFNQPLIVQITPNNPEICAGDTNVTLSAMVSGGAPPYQYLWNTGDTIQSITPTPGTISVTITDQLGCPTPADSVTIIENPLPIITFPIIPDVCLDDPPFTLSSAIPQGGVYSGTGITGGNTFNPLLAGIGTFTISYVYVDSNGCKAKALQIITVNPLPIITFPIIPDVCLDDPPFTLSSAIPQGGVYSGTGITGGNTFNPLLAGIGTFTISYVYLDSNGCKAIALQLITVNPSPSTSDIYHY
ncbi:SprB repeat-containing protein [candidate division KSB1 bacterium]